MIIDENASFIDLSVVVPAHNEEESIARVIEDLASNLPGCEIIIVDDCSTDGTRHRVEELRNVRLLSLTYNHGYGGAIRQGILAASRGLVAWFDGDNEHNATDLGNMVIKLRSERLGAVLGERDSSVSNTRSIGKLLIRLFALALGLGYVRDFNCGLRVFRRDALLRFFLLLPTGYSASTTSTFLIIRSRIPFAFQPIKLRPRIGSSKVKLFDGFRTFVNILRIASLLQPLRLFGTVSSIIGFFGLSYSVIIMRINHQGLPVLGSLLMLVALLLIGIAILADQVGLLRMQHSAAVGLSMSSEVEREKRANDGNH